MKVCQAHNMRHPKLDRFVVFSENECYAPTILASRDRAMTYENATVDYKCDKQLLEGWYRFQGGAGDGMANTCVAKPKCTTLVQGWLKVRGLMQQDDDAVRGR